MRDIHPRSYIIMISDKMILFPIIKDPLLSEFFTMTGEKKNCHKIISLELIETSP